LANASSLLTLNPIIVYATLALYGLLFVLTFLYLHTRFRAAKQVLALVKTDWEAAQSQHMGLVQSAQSQLARMPAQAAKKREPAPVARIATDTRSQVVAMGRKGMATPEIARSMGLPEGEVDVLLGLARMQR
jgi:DNA-directed RNA polymerase specialized sigma24 family protein